MKTHYGRECKYFYGDYYRGKNNEACRAFDKKAAERWTPDLCKNCPVPGIQLANECKNMIVTVSVEKKLFGMIKNVKANAFCTLTKKEVDDPYIGCGKCHELPELFKLDGS